MTALTMDRVGAVVVTWHPGPVFQETVNAVAGQVDRVIIVDNGSGSETVAMLHHIQTRYPETVQVRFNTENLGIGAAQNQGVARAMADGCDWVLLLDHDSVPAPGMVAHLLHAFDRLGRPDRVGMMVPRKRERQIDTEMKVITGRCRPRIRYFGPRPVVRDVRFAVASGSLIRNAVFQEVGRFDDTFFMDYVDVEFCLRMVGLGWEIVAVRDAVLHHRLGNIIGRQWLGKTVSVYRHAPSRRFTLFRNRVRVWKRYALSQPGYIGFDMGMALYELAKICRYETGRRRSLSAAFRGMLTGLTESWKRPGA